MHIVALSLLLKGPIIATKRIRILTILTSPSLARKEGEVRKILDFQNDYMYREQVPDTPQFSKHT